MNVRGEKPGALRFALSVGVEVHRTRSEWEASVNHVFVALGSNIQRESNMPEAVRRLALHFRLVAVSPVCETTPVGNTKQPNFLNAAALM